MRNERGVVFPSPVVMLSIVAVAMAGVAYVATQGQEPTEREILTTSRPAEPTQSVDHRKLPALPKKQPAEIKKKPPAVQKGEVYVEVYNNSGITGLAARVAGQASGAGWQVVAADNWYGSVPGSTVYFPERLERAAKLLALDLGISRVMPAIEGPMDLDRLTVILTADAA
ncbi:MAG: LytR C-terminal domain-containing protein [Nocardioides sp.]